MGNMLKSTHPVIFGIGTVECIVSSDKTELVRSCAGGTAAFEATSPCSSLAPGDGQRE